MAFSRRLFLAFSLSTRAYKPRPRLSNSSSLCNYHNRNHLHTSLKRARLPSSATVKSASWMSFLGSLFGSSARAEDNSNNNSKTPKMSYPDQRSDEEWRAVLSPEQFRVIRQKGTEPAFTGEYDKHYPSTGVYNCAACDTPLYKADTKFKSGCGWPAYFDAIPGAVTRHVDRAFGMERTEIVCSQCGGHLGHVFKGEGFPTPTDERHCVNSVSLRFEASPDKETAKA
ncbi:hypothetical protein PISL3812_01416 [Talaromyces islandicus]|uniref:Peptide-methionine (R)-S-oxide reductase n=1 Tax=Talaromyces islandicus TaxID=28573 RepID=A0A0U1LM25_TALIS|nr:hypothetical protein PISL3812_01416 [Talaromyces islandicus]